MNYLIIVLVLFYFCLNKLIEAVNEKEKKTISKTVIKLTDDQKKIFKQIKADLFEQGNKTI